VSLIADLKSRFAHLIHELAKFGSVGAIAFVITIGLSNLLKGTGHAKAFAVATVVATTFAYFANRFWTFRHTEQSDMRREYVLFFVLNAIGLVISELFILFTYYTLDLHDAISYNISMIVGTGVATLFRFWSYKKWVFLAKVQPAPAPVESLPAEALPVEALPGDPLPAEALPAEAPSLSTLHPNG
jgi:putative flippase GtrA